MNRLLWIHQCIKLMRIDWSLNHLATCVVRGLDHGILRLLKRFPELSLIWERGSRRYHFTMRARALEIRILLGAELSHERLKLRTRRCRNLSLRWEEALAILPSGKLPWSLEPLKFSIRKAERFILISWRILISHSKSRSLLMHALSLHLSRFVHRGVCCFILI